MDSCSPPKAKRHRTEASPLSFVTWNCDGFLPRCKGFRSEIERLVRETNSPDVVLIQEVRCKTISPNQRSSMVQKDMSVIRSVLETAFRDYQPYFSLADKRHSGTCTLIHNRLGSYKPDASFSTEGATDMLLNKLGLTRDEVGITTARPVKNKKQPSVASFFAPKKSPAACKQHHPEGRFQYFSFPDVDLIHTYAPNNGSTPESFARRQEWDKEMLEFLMNRQTILQKANVSKPLMWAGDLNVARDYRDGTHWRRNEDGSIFEWWTDESKCFTKDRLEKMHNTPECNKGMPSFTLAERERFNNILDQAHLTDVWRELHPNGSSMHSHLSQWERPNWTWRGALGLGGNKAKYQGRAQRLDYFLTSGLDMDLVESCEVLGYGERRDGLFCGSDHCAVKLQLRADKEGDDGTQ